MDIYIQWQSITKVNLIPRTLTNTRVTTLISYIVRAGSSISADISMLTPESQSGRRKR